MTNQVADMRIDIGRAEEILRAEGLEILRSGVRYIGGWVPAAKQRPGMLNAVLVTDKARAVIGGVQRDAADMEALAAALTHAAALCRRIEAGAVQEETP